MKTTESFIICFQLLCLAAESIDFLFSFGLRGKPTERNPKTATKNEDNKQELLWTCAYKEHLLMYVER